MRDSKARSRPAHMRVAAAQLLLTSVAPMAGLDLYDAGAKLVAELIVDQYPDLLEIELDDNRISDASAEVLGAAIRTSTELRTLHLDGNDLTADAVQHLIEPLCSGKLRRLHFNDNMLGDAGATLLASLIERSHTLRVLNLKRAPPSFRHESRCSGCAANVRELHIGLHCAQAMGLASKAHVRCSPQFATAAAHSYSTSACKATACQRRCKKRSISPCWSGPQLYTKLGGSYNTN